MSRVVSEITGILAGVVDVLPAFLVGQAAYDVRSVATEAKFTVV